MSKKQPSRADSIVTIILSTKFVTKEMVQMAEKLRYMVLHMKKPITAADLEAQYYKDHNE